MVRYNGGANAGHSVWIGDRRKAFHLMPSGILRDGVLNVIGNGTALDPAQLIKEMDELQAEGYPVDPDRLAISDRAHVVMPYHKIEDELMDRAFASGENGEIGTTRRGIGPCYADKAHRVTAVRMADIKDQPYLGARLPRLVSLKNSLLGALATESGRDFRQLASEPIMEQCAEWGSRLAPYITDTEYVLDDARRSGKNILFEGAHAALLDVDFGTYPYCTSSVCSPGGALAGTGLAARTLGEVVGGRQVVHEPGGRGAVSDGDRRRGGGSDPGGRQRIRHLHGTAAARGLAGSGGTPAHRPGDRGDRAGRDRSGCPVHALRAACLQRLLDRHGAGRPRARQRAASR